MNNINDTRPVRTEYLGLVIAIVPGAIIAALLWLVTIPLLHQATGTSLAVATFISVTSLVQGVSVHRRGWRSSLITAGIQFVVVWPLFWLLASYSSRHPQ